MENSIVFNHPLDLITTPTDGKLFNKTELGWEEVANQLYKSEKKLPTNDLGNDGDYYAFYGRKNNLLLYSEDFNNNIWKRYNSIVNKEPTVKFPLDESSKLCATKSNTSHNISYTLSNDNSSNCVFSVYVKPNDLSKVQLKITDELYNDIIITRFNLNKEDSKLSVTINNEDAIKFINASIEQTEIKKPDRSFDYYYRIWISAKFLRAYYLTCEIAVLNENGEEIFSALNDTQGLFINSAQISFMDNLLTVRPKTDYEGEQSIVQELGSQHGYPYTYVKSTNYVPTSLYLKSLYKKIDNNWKTIDNDIIYFDSNILDNAIGNVGDISTLSSIIKISPAILVGDSSNISKLSRPIGTIRYSKIKKRWFVQYDKNKEYSLEYKNPKPDYNRAAMALTLNQQTYQTYSRYCSTNARHYKGLSNTGGCYNDWSRIHINR